MVIGLKLATGMRSKQSNKSKGVTQTVRVSTKGELYGNTDSLANNSESYTLCGEVMTDGVYLSREVKRSGNIRRYYCTVFNIAFLHCLGLELAYTAA